MRTALLASALCALAGCGETVDTAGLPSTDGFADWHQETVIGDAPGHGDTYRIIYVNDVARAYGGAGKYPVGSVIVKEIFERDGDSQGDLSYVAIMRRVDESDPAVDGLSLGRGWLFTMASEVGETETQHDFCWDACHQAAPIDGAFFDYGE